MLKKEFMCDCSVIHEDIVADVKHKMPKETEFSKISDFFKVFGDKTRSKIIWALDQRELCVCDLAVLLNMTKSAISHQLSFLKQANLVKFRREGKMVYYSLADEHVKLVFETGRAHINE